MSLKWPGITYPTPFVFKWRSNLFARDRRNKRCRQNSFKLDGTGEFEFEDGFIVKGASQNSVKFWDDETRLSLMKDYVWISTKWNKKRWYKKYKARAEELIASKRKRVSIETGLEIPEVLTTRMCLSGVPLEIHTALKHIAATKNKTISQWVVDLIVERVLAEIEMEKDEELEEDGESE